MANIDRFFQDLGNMKKSPLDLSSYEPITEERNFLELGTIIVLKGNKYGDVEIVGRLRKYDNKLYDYVGEYEDETGLIKKIYFDEDLIEEIKKKEVNHK